MNSERKCMEYMTPIFKCNSLIEKVNIYIKREDLLPFSFGGNKVRIAEEYYQDMLDKGNNCMIGYGNARSNLCRVLANMMWAHNIECHIISPADDDGERLITNNSRIIQACKAQYHYCSKLNVAETVDSVIKACEKKGLKPYYIYGNTLGEGNESVPVRAYVKVYEEICAQEKWLQVKFDYIFVSTGTGMTQAGLIVGNKLHGEEKRIVGVSVARSTEKEKDILRKYVQSYFDEVSFGVANFEDAEVVEDYLCGGYGKYSKEVIDTIQYMMVKEGIPLDPTYTGKGFWGMLSYLKRNNIKGNILFIHTGGLPLFFDNLKTMFAEE